jgi:outer membrane lipoprotein-sorting protein
VTNPTFGTVTTSDGALWVRKPSDVRADYTAKSGSSVVVTNGTKGTVVLRLKPNQSSAACKELFLVVDPSDWHVKESIVIDSSGEVNDFELFAPNVTASVKASLFEVNPAALPGYKVVRP